MNGKFKVPRRFVLKGHEWKVRRPKRVVVDGDECRGSCDYETRTIRLRKDLKGDEERQIFLHEWVHAVAFEAHLDEGSGLSSNAEEIVCDAVSTSMLECFNVTLRKFKRKK